MPSLVGELAFVLCEPQKRVQKVLDYILSCGMAEMKDEKTLFLPGAVSGVGAEGASAQRTREYRQRLHASQCDTDVTDEKHASDGDIEIEKEIESEIDKETEIDKEIRDNKKEKDKKEKFSPEPELNEALVSFIDFRKQAKKPMTDRAVDLLMDELEDITHDTGEKVKILNRSVVNGWSGIYPLDGGEKNRKSVPADPIPQYGIVL